MSTTSTATAVPDHPRHEQFWGLGDAFTAEQQRTLYAVGHLAAGFLGLLVAAPLGAYVDLSGTDDTGGDDDAGFADTALAVTTMAVRGITLVTGLIDDPIPIRDPGLAWMRRATGVFGVMSAGVAIAGSSWDSGVALMGRRGVALDAITTYFALIPTIYTSAVELPAEPASPEKTLTILDEAGNFCDGAVVFLQLALVANKEQTSRAALVAVRTLLVMGVGGLHIAQAMVALDASKKEVRRGAGGG